MCGRLTSSFLAPTAPSGTASTDCEFVAITFALLRALPEGGHALIEIYIDSEVSVKTLLRQYEPDPWGQVAALAFIVFDVASALRPVSMAHVYGHQGHPWNIMADFIASGTMRGGIPEVALPPPFRGPRPPASTPLGSGSGFGLPPQGCVMLTPSGRKQLGPSPCRHQRFPL